MVHRLQQRVRPAVLAGDIEKARAARRPAGGEVRRARGEDLRRSRLATEQARVERGSTPGGHPPGNYVFFGVAAAILLLLAALIASNISGGITRPLADTVGVLEAVAQVTLTRRLESTSTDGWARWPTR